MSGSEEFVDMSSAMQQMIDSGVNAFAVQLVAENFALLREGGEALAEPLRFSFRGVRFTIEEDPESDWSLRQAKGSEIRSAQEGKS